MKEAFKSYFPDSGKPVLVWAPGRVNLIGEHTDYNDGFVLPGAIDKGIGFAIQKNGTQQIRLVALDLEARYECNLGEIEPVSGKDYWANYVLGMVDQFLKQGLELGGFDMVFSGNIPQGAGLSSSAALECGSGYAMMQVFGFELDRVKLAQLAQKAEHTYPGLRCGIMDMFTSSLGKAGQVIQLDCRSLDFSYFPLSMESHLLMLCNTQVNHSLADSEYNTRREECEQGVRHIQKKYPSVLNLRDVSLEMLDSVKSELSETVYRRCHYVISENGRVQRACQALEAGDLIAFGKLMYQSHEGLQHQYEVSCPELDFLVDQSRAMPYVLGARMMGGGFGGCTINLVNKAQIDTFRNQMGAAFQQKFGRSLPMYEVSLSEGVNLQTG